MYRLHVFTTFLFSFTLLAPVSGQFLPGTAFPGLGHPRGSTTGVNAITPFDDGQGEDVYVGGRFAFADGIRVNSIGRWDGTSWSPLALGVGNPTDTNGSVYAMAVHDDGSGSALYVGGDFFGASGVTVNHIARWDGANWSPLGNGLAERVWSMAVYDEGAGPRLFVGTTTSLERWNGSAWQPLLPVRADALATFDDGTGSQLYAAAPVAIEGGTTQNIASWDGTAWHPLGDFPGSDGVDGAIEALATFDDGTGTKLYVGGNFQTAGGLAAPYLAAWTGTAWEAVPSPPVADRVCSLHVFDDGAPRLIAGIMDELGALVFAWDGQTWSELADPERLGSRFNCARGLGTFDSGDGPVLFAGGDFQRSGDTLNLSRIAQWDGQSWSAVSAPDLLGTDDQVNAMEVYDDGNGNALYIGGWIRYGGAAVVRGVARYEGTSWSPLRDAEGLGLYATDQSVGAGVFDLEVFDDGGGSGAKLYAIGDITREGLSENIAAWDGNAWQPVGGDLDDWGERLQVFDDGNGPALYLSGRFTTAGGVTVNGIAKWDGTAYSPLDGPGGPGVNGPVRAMEVFDDGFGPALYVGGSFTEVGGLAIPYLARWHPAEGWTPVNGLTVDNTVLDMEVYDDGSGPALFIGGAFDTVNGIFPNGIVEWNGAGVDVLHGPAGVGLLSEGDAGAASKLLAYDAGAGERLYVAGFFDTAGGISAQGLAAWDGVAWRGLTGNEPILNEDNFGSSPSIEALFGFQDDGLPTLFLGGEFTHMGGIPSWHLGRYRDSIDVFSDGFESGDVSSWSSASGSP